MTSPIKDLVRLITDRWWDKGNRIDAFAEVATSVLTELGLHEALGVQGAFDYLLRRQNPEQASGEHGAPNIVPVVRTPNFGVVLHFWFGQVAPPHCHDWHGAFQVIQGSCLHT